MKLSKTQLSYQLFRLKRDDDAVEFGKQNYHAFSNLREELQSRLAADMLQLHDVKNFLKRKQKQKNAAFNPVELRTNGSLSPPASSN